MLKAGYSVSKKHGKSVTRNRIKRLLRAAFNALKKEISGGYIMIFLPKVREDYRFDVFLKEMRYLLEKEGIIKKEAER